MQINVPYGEILLWHNKQTTTGPTSILVKPKIKLHETLKLNKSQTGHCVTKNSVAAVHIVNNSDSTLLAVA